MSKAAFAQKKRNPRRSRELSVVNDDNFDQQTHTKPQTVNTAPIRAQNPAQQRYIDAIHGKTITLASGPAGVGKTYLAGALAAELLKAGKIDKIIITRPAVEAGEKLGFLPGEVEDKYAPYLAPFRDVLDERLGKSFVSYLMKTGKIEAAPLAYMRGRTFKNAVVILDEAQNTTPVQMKMFLTRLGINATAIVNGDLQQKDIPGLSGFQDAITRLSFIPSLGHVAFDHNDVVRSDIVQEIVQAYEVGLDPVYNDR